MNNGKILSKKIPTALGLIILLGGLVAGIILVNRSQGLETQAGPTESPKNVKVSNLGSTTFSVSWTTDTPVTGFLLYSEDPSNIKTPAGDVRDQISGTAQSYTNHYVNISGLSAGKTYYYLIGSGPQTYNNDGRPYQTGTLQQVITPPEDVASGKIVNAGGTGVNGAIVYVEVEGGETLSAVTNSDGGWRINIAASRKSDGSVLTYEKTSALISIFVQAGVSGSATALTNTGKAAPVPDIVLGKNQSFIDVTATDLASQQALDSAIKTAGFTTLANTPGQGGLTPEQEAMSPVKVLSPEVSGENIATSSPEFIGKALPNMTLKVTVHSAVEMSQVVQSDTNGDWSWTPPQNLEPGAHTLTLEYTDQSGIVQKIVRNFTVLASDGGPLPAFTATPSAVTPTITPTTTLTPTPTEVVRTTMPSTASGVPESGVEMPTILVLVLGLLLLAAGKYSSRWIKQNNR